MTRSFATPKPFSLGLLLLFFTTGNPAAEPIPVQTRPFSALAIYPPHSAPASVVSNNRSRISAEIGARIVAIPVRVGDRVKKGALLAQLENADLALALERQQAALQAIDAKLELARYELRRAQSLSKKQAVSEQLLRQREAAVDTLLAERRGQQAAVAQARRQLDKTELRAPFDAVVLARPGQVGELAGPGTPLLQIIDTDSLEVSAALPASLAETLRDDDSPAFVSDGIRHPLRLRRITPALDTRSHTREARLEFTGSAALPGASGELVWRSAEPRLPAEFVSRRNGRLGVLIRDGDRARFVVLARAENGRPAVAELPPDTAIITAGRYRVDDGDALVSAR